MASTPNPRTTVTRGYFHITVGPGNLNSAATRLMNNDNYADGCLTRADELEDANGHKYILAPFVATDVAGLQAEVENQISTFNPTITQASVTRYHSENDSGKANKGNSCPNVEDEEPHDLTGGSNRWG